MKQLLSWYYKQRKAFPWRLNQDPYRIWISEVMLQQTQVNTVIPYYEKWMKKFPDIGSVANGKTEELLKLWEGLGYYTRAHNIKKSCDFIIKDNNKVFPSKYDDLIKLYGVGDYICSAILSIAFNEPFPAIDGNVKRVCSRYWGENYINSKDQKKLLEKLNKIIDKKKPGCFNQAMMDLGREVCKPKNPYCKECPLKKSCFAYQNSKTEFFPQKIVKRKVPIYKVVVAMLLNSERKFLITKRPVNKMLGGLWELPGGKVNKSETLKEALCREIKEELDVGINIHKKLGAVQHTYSHMKIILHGYYCTIKNGKMNLNESDDGKWIDLKNIKDYAFPRASHKLFSIIKEYNNG